MDIVAELLSRGADPCITSRNEGWDALQWATNTPGSAGDREGVIKLLEEWHRGNTTAVEERLVVEEEPAERGEQPKRKEDSWTEISSGNIKKAVQEWLRDQKSAAEKYEPIN